MGAEPGGAAVSAAIGVGLGGSGWIDGVCVCVGVGVGGWACGWVGVEGSAPVAVFGGKPKRSTNDYEYAWC